MNKIIKRSLIGAWVFFATLLLARSWLVRPDLFPRIPQPIILWLVDLYGSRDGEELADLELLLALGLASVIVLAITTLGMKIRRK